MSFSPVPTSLTTDLRRAGDGPVVELGAGDGRFAQVLGAACAGIIRLDRRRAGGATDLVGDVLRPPLRDRSCALLAAANLLRHLWRQDFDVLLARWTTCLRPGGPLWILEDAPESERPAVRNYHDLQTWLSGLVPGRGPLRSLADFRARIPGAAPADAWTYGQQENRYPRPNVESVLTLLRGTGRAPAPEAAALARRIEAEGLDYGDFWWARYDAGEGA